MEVETEISCVILVKFFSLSFLCVCVWKVLSILLFICWTAVGLCLGFCSRVKYTYLSARSLWCTVFLSIALKVEVGSTQARVNLKNAAWTEQCWAVTAVAHQGGRNVHAVLFIQVSTFLLSLLWFFSIECNFIFPFCNPRPLSFCLCLTHTFTQNANTRN